LISYSRFINRLTVEFDYDVQGRVTKALYPDGNYVTYTYDELDRLTSEKYQPKDGTLRITSFSYDDLNRKTTSTLPNQEKREVMFTPFGLDIQSKRIIGTEEKTEEKILEKKESYNGKIANKFIPFGNQSMSTKYEYDSQFRIKSITDPIGQKTLYSYSNVTKNETTGNEVLRNTVKQVLPNGKEEITYHDEYGRKVKILELSPSKSKERTTTFTYSTLGHVTEQRVTSKGKTQVTNFGYDSSGNLSYVKDDLKQEYSYVYDRLGNLLQIIKDGKVDVENKYNEIGWRMSKVQPNGCSNTFSYLSNGLLAKQIDKMGNTHEYSYEPTYELKQHQVKDQIGEVVYWRKFTYDEENRLTNESNSENEIISYTFDEWNRQKTFTTVNRTYTLGYDSYDRMNFLQYPDGNITNYTFDDINRIQSVLSPKMGAVQYSYEMSNDNNTYTIEYPSNMKQQKTWDSFGELLNVNHFEQSETPIWTETYGYDGFGNIESIDKNGQQYKFAYDGINRLSEENSVIETSSYLYDHQGNRRTLQTTKNLQVSSSEYSFNEVNQLSSFTIENGQKGSFTYYPNGLRATKTVDNETTRYIYLNGVVIEELDGEGNVKAQNIWGNELLHRSVTGKKSGYYFYNGHGDVVEIKDGNGNTLNQYEFDIWGNIISEKEDPNMDNPFLYSGEMFDKETGLYYLRARYYDPGMGRFISEDTYEGELKNPLSLNYYTYVYNNPLRYKDPSGNIPVETIADVLSIGYSGFNLWKNPSWSNAGYLAWDVGAALIPYVPGSYVAKGFNYATQVYQAGKKIDSGINGLWNMGAFKRGQEIEKLLGGWNNNFPIIDMAVKNSKNIASSITSIKSLDLTAKSYQTETQFYNAIMRYTKKLSNFTNTTYGGNIVNVDSNTIRYLQLAFPDVKLSQYQAKALDQAIQDAANMGVTIKVTIIK
jgi:RHS repeat-associated protein